MLYHNGYPRYFVGNGLVIITRMFSKPTRPKTPSNSHPKMITACLPYLGAVSVQI